MNASSKMRPGRNLGEEEGIKITDSPPTRARTMLRSVRQFQGLLALPETFFVGEIIVSESSKALQSRTLKGRKGHGSGETERTEGEEIFNRNF